ncbi:MAG TPA: hypothetical protein VGI39_45870 [Polyangiaceae bacterium]|jgi:tetratricopeptide (TPR) repeat protein
MGVIESLRGAASKRAAVAETVEPSDGRVLLRLGEGRARARDLEGAYTAYTRAGELYARQGFARRALSACHLAMDAARTGGLVDRVAPLARTIAALYIDERLPCEAAAGLDAAIGFLLERGVDADALPLLEQRVGIEDTDVARVRFAEALARQGENDESIAQLTLVFDRLSARGHTNEALDVVERILGQRRDKELSLAAAKLYLARNQAGDPFLALAKLRVCCDGDASDVSTLELLARAFDQAGHPEKAARVRREIAALTRPAPPPFPRSLPRLSPSPPPVVDAEVDAGWDDLLVEVVEPPIPTDRRSFAPDRPSFWPADESPRPDESGSVVSVSLADVELVGGALETRPDQPVSLLETALECVDSLVAQRRYDEATALLARHLTIRPHNPLLLERKAELDELARILDTASIASPSAPPAPHAFEGPPPALFSMPKRAALARIKVSG